MHGVFVQGYRNALDDIIAGAKFENIGYPFFQAILNGFKCPLCLGSPRNGGFGATSTVGTVVVCNQAKDQSGVGTNCGAGLRAKYCGEGDHEKMEGLSQFYVAKVNSEKRTAADDAEKPKKKRKISKDKDEKEPQELVAVEAIMITGNRVQKGVAQVRVKYRSLCHTADKSHWITVDKMNGDESMAAIIKEYRKTNLAVAKEIRLGIKLCDIPEKDCKSASTDCEVIQCCMHSSGCGSRVCDGCTEPSCPRMCAPCVDADHVDEDNVGLFKTSKGKGFVFVCGNCVDRCVVCAEQGGRHDEDEDLIKCSQCELEFKDSCGDQGKCNLCAPCRICDTVVSDNGGTVCRGCNQRTHVGCCPFVDTLPQFLKSDDNLSTMAGYCASCIGRCGTCYEEVEDEQDSCTKCQAFICDECVGQNLIVDGLCFTCAHHQDPSGDVVAEKRVVFSMIGNAFTDVLISDKPPAVRSCLVLLQGSMKPKSWAWQ